MAVISMSRPPRSAAEREPPAYEIEKGVPLPPRIRNREANRSKYPFTRMQVGDSFFVRGRQAMNRIRTAASWAAARHGMKFSCHKMDGGIRVWRTK
jgi:hypothetical protein